MSATPASEALIGWGLVRHTRHRPAHHAFAYPTAFLLLPMRSLQAGRGGVDLAINRRAWFAFHDADHGDGRPAEAGGALAWLEELLHQEGIHDATGEVWLGVAALNRKLVDELQTSDEYLSERARNANLFHLHYAERKSLQERIGMAASGTVENTVVGLWSKLSRLR